MWAFSVYSWLDCLIALGLFLAAVLTFGIVSVIVSALLSGGLTALLVRDVKEPASGR